MYGKVFKNALFDFFQTIMVFVQYLGSMRQVMLHPSPLFPRHGQHPIQIGTDDGGFGRGGRHHLELAELLGGLVDGLLRHPGFLDALLVLFRLVGYVLELAHLFLDGLHLLIEIVLALGLLHLILDPRADALLDLQQIDFGLDQCHQVFDPIAHAIHLEQFLLVIDLQ